MPVPALSRAIIKSPKFQALLIRVQFRMRIRFPRKPPSQEPSSLPIQIIIPRLANPLSKCQLKPKTLAVSSGQSIALQAQAILDRSCAGCHNANNAQGNFGTISNVEDMIASGRYIVPASPDRSLIYTRMLPGGQMPPAGSLKNEDIAIVKQWIAEIKEVENPILSDAALLSLLRNDIDTNVVAKRKSRIRYFSLQVPNNLNVSVATLESLRQAFRKVINSLSKADRIVKPEVLDPERLIYRINLDDYKISPALFDKIVGDFNPYAPSFVNVSGADAQTKANTSNHAFLKNATQSSQYLLRMDWFVASAALPELYSRFINLAANQFALEKELGIDVKSNIENGRVIRSGFKNSNVSSQNRVIERHTQANKQAYWVSYDFASNEALGNIFKSPLGPENIYPSDNAFKHDGGEIIYTLPNGLFAYYLSNAAGTQIDKGPLNIVKQLEAPAQFLTAIVNGISCMNCHNAGYLYKKDEIRPFVIANKATLPKGEFDEVLKLYPEEAVYKAAFDRDNEVYFKALAEAGIDPSKPDPLNLAYRYYNRALTRNDLREELGITDTELDRLLSREPFRSQWTGLQTSGGFLKREEFNLIYAEALKQAKKTTIPIFPFLGDMVITTSCMFANPLQMDACLLPKP